MSVTAIGLVLVSAFVHAGWNLLGKRDGASTAYFFVACAAGAAVIAPMLLVWSASVVRMPAVVWLYLIPAGLFQGLYFVGLAGAYRTGDLSVAYPVARALPVLMVPLVTVLIGTGESPSALALGGMVTVAVGLLVIPQQRLARVSIRYVGGAWIAYAFLAGVGTAGYSLIDDAALALFRAALESGPAPTGVSGGAAAGVSAQVQAPVIYSAFQSMMTAAGLAILGAGQRGVGGFAAELRRTQLRSAAAAGVAIVAAYCLVLVAYGFARNVSYVVAFRQISLPLGALLGVMILRERMTVARATGTAVILAGLVLVSIG